MYTRLRNKASLKIILMNITLDPILSIIVRYGLLYQRYLFHDNQSKVPFLRRIKVFGQTARKPRFHGYHKVVL